MNIFQIIAKLYTAKDPSWIDTLEDREISPHVINNWLSMNNKAWRASRVLDQYTYHLPKKMWLSLAWSIVPKYEKAPFAKYIKKKKEHNNRALLDKTFKDIIQKKFSLGDSDMLHTWELFVEKIKQNPEMWYDKLGLPPKNRKEIIGVGLGW